MAVAKLDVIEQLFNNSGLLNAGGLVYTYAGGTSTPLATYSDATGLIPNANPVVLDSSGRADLWFTRGVSYKVVEKTPEGVTLHTVDAIIAPDATAVTGSQYADIVFEYPGGPPVAAVNGTSAAWLGGERINRAISFGVDFTGSGGFCLTHPTASFVATIRKNATANNNGTALGTVTIATDGTFAFATTSHATQSLAIGDTLQAFGPTTADATIADFGFTLAGTLV